MRIPIIAVLCLVSVSATAQTPETEQKHLTVRRDDFAYGAKLATDAAYALQRLVLPASVYDALTRPDAGDLAVFNASGSQVPHALARASESVHATPDLNLPVFPLRAASRDQLMDLQVNIERSENGAVASVRTSAQEQSTLVAYLIDLTSATHPVRSLTFHFKEGEQSFVQPLVIWSSNDLASWNIIADNVTVASLMHDGHRIAKDRVEITPVVAKYLRITWPDKPPPRDLDGVTAGLSASTSEPAREWAPVKAVTTPRPSVYRFKLDGFRPVDRVRVHLPEDNTLAEATLDSAASPDGPWTTRYNGLVYRLDSTGVGDLAISVEDVADPYWQLEVSPTGGGIGNGAPTFEVGWLPHELLFVARGEAPFTLAYGNANTAVPSFSRAALATMGRDGDGEAIGEAHVVDAKIELGGASRLIPEPPDATLPLRRIVLWASLSAAVLLLGWMSVRLFRQLGT